MVKIQCGYEDSCKFKSCLDCKRFLKFKAKYKRLTLAEVTCIEDFAIVDLELWLKEKPKEVLLSQIIMCKLIKKIDWR